ncbi:MAG: hypothetical protein ONA69_08510 [candidate division KSB1 bacterium]|nr:hypothetical protein [candidate division KSB1 bacterium]
MKAFSIFVFVCAALCGRRVDNSARNPALVRAPIDSIRVTEAPNGKEAVLEIFGQLPSPAYSLDHVEIVRKGNRITVIPWLNYRRDQIVIMMTVPFQHKISLPLQKNGRFAVQVEGANRTYSEDLIRKR